LEVETAGEAVDVQDLAGEIQAGADLRFHGGRIDFAERDAARINRLLALDRRWARSSPRTSEILRL